jgi:hypothetical protein
LLADKPFQRRDPGFILLKKIRRGRVFVKGAGLVLLTRPGSGFGRITEPVL